MPTPTLAAVRESNRRALEILGQTPELTLDLSGVDEQPVLVLTDVCIAAVPGARLLLQRTCATREDALALIAAGTFEDLLPTVLVDLGDRDLPGTVLRYDLVHGLEEATRFALPDPDTATAEEIRDEIADLRHMLGHDD